MNKQRAALLGALVLTPYAATSPAGGQVDTKVDESTSGGIDVV